ncbi:MAG: hypothetical protein JWO32_1666 [Bacteroidetes bacterium]|nr:hypothetical protein [Bacteroidota bacterium]
MGCVYPHLARINCSMDISKALEAEHSKAQTLKIVNYVGRDKRKFDKLVSVFLNSEYRITQRAAWPLSNSAIVNPALIKPHFAGLINKLQNKNEHPAIARNILRIFQEIDIPKKYHGILIDICFGFITDLGYPVAVRAFAITVASHICIHYPELKKELTLLLDDLKKYPASPAVTSRIKAAEKLLK